MELELEDEVRVSLESYVHCNLKKDVGLAPCKPGVAEPVLVASAEEVDAAKKKEELELKVLKAIMLRYSGDSRGVLNSFVQEMDPLEAMGRRQKGSGVHGYLDSEARRMVEGQCSNFSLPGKELTCMGNSESGDIQDLAGVVSHAGGSMDRDVGPFCQLRKQPL